MNRTATIRVASPPRATRIRDCHMRGLSLHRSVQMPRGAPHSMHAPRLVPVPAMTFHPTPDCTPLLVSLDCFDKLRALQKRHSNPSRHLHIDLKDLAAALVTHGDATPRFSDDVLARALDNARAALTALPPGQLPPRPASPTDPTPGFRPLLLPNVAFARLKALQSWRSSGHLPVRFDLKDLATAWFQQAIATPGFIDCALQRALTTS